MVYSRYTKQRILHLHLYQHQRPPTISKILEKEGIKVSRRGTLKLLSRYYRYGTIARKPGSGRPSLVTAEVKNIVEAQMQKDDETTAYQLHSLLNSLGYPLSLRTILQCRTALGWTFRGSSYCQLIRDVNKVRLVGDKTLSDHWLEMTLHLLPLIYSKTSLIRTSKIRATLLFGQVNHRKSQK